MYVCSHKFKFQRIDKKIFPRAGEDTEHKQNNAKHRLDVQKYEIKKNQTKSLSLSV